MCNTKLTVQFDTNPDTSRQLEWLMEENSDVAKVVDAFDRLTRDYDSNVSQRWKLTLERIEGV